MNENREKIILRERTADVGRLFDVLRGWGYEESEIKSFLTEQKADQKLGLVHLQSDSQGSFRANSRTHTTER